MFGDIGDSGSHHNHNHVHDHLHSHMHINGEGHSHGHSHPHGHSQNEGHGHSLQDLSVGLAILGKNLLAVHEAHHLVHMECRVGELYSGLVCLSPEFKLVGREHSHSLQ